MSTFKRNSPYVDLASVYIYLPNVLSGKCCEINCVSKDSHLRKDDRPQITFETYDSNCYIYIKGRYKCHNKSKAHNNYIEISFLPTALQKFLNMIEEKVDIENTKPIEQDPNKRYKAFNNYSNNGYTPPTILKAFESKTYEAKFKTSSINILINRQKHSNSESGIKTYLELVEPTSSQIMMTCKEIRIVLKMYDDFNSLIEPPLKELFNDIEKTSKYIDAELRIKYRIKDFQQQISQLNALKRTFDEKCKVDIINPHNKSPFL